MIVGLLQVGGQFNLWEFSDSQNWAKVCFALAMSHEALNPPCFGVKDLLAGHGSIRTSSLANPCNVDGSLFSPLQIP